MPDARSSKPLFELLREQPAGADDAAAPPPVQAEAGRPAPRGMRAIRIPLSTAYISVALIAGLMLLAWVGGHAVGYSAGQDELARAVTPDMRADTRADLIIRDPIVAGVANEGGFDAAPDAIPAIQPGPREPAQAVGGDPSDAAGPVGPLEPTGTEPDDGEIITATGMLHEDPREPLVNYLVLATLAEGRASEAVQFLATRGVEAIAVPTRPGSGLYRVVSLEVAVPSGAYRERAADRHRHEAEVAGLGRVWLRQHGGSSDFSSTMWALYEP